MGKTVLFTASTYSHLAAFHRPYLRAFRELDWNVQIACGGEELPIPEADRVIPLSFEKKMTSPANFRAQKTLRQAMERCQYDLVCTHTSLAAFFTRRAAAGLPSRPPIVNVAHGYLFGEDTPALKKAVLVEAERLTAPQTDLLLTMNAWDYDAAVRGRLARRIESIPGIGVDFSRFDPPPAVERGAFRARYGCGDDDFLLLYAAEFSGRKNQAMLIRALRRLPARVRLLLPGRGAALEDCRRLADSLGVAERVLFPGHLTDMASCCRAADAAVSSSRSEGLPFNVMEALYCSLPAVVSDIKGHRDLIRDGENGLLFPSGDEGAFAQCVLRLLDRPELARRLSGAARDSVLPYRLDAVLPTVLSAYLSVLPPQREEHSDLILEGASQ